MKSASTPLMKNSIFAILSKLKASKKTMYSVQIKMVTFQFADMLTIALLMERFYDRLVLGSSFIWYLIPAIVINIAYSAVMRYIEQYLLENAETAVKMELYEQSYDAIQGEEKPVTGTSKYISELIQNIELAASLIAHSVPDLVTSAVLLILSFAVIITVNIQFFIGYFLIFALSTSTHIWYDRKLSEKKKTIQENTARANSFFTETLNGITTIKAFRQDTAILKQGKNQAEAVKTAEIQYENIYLRHELINNLLFYISEALPILLGFYLSLVHQAELGQVLFLLQFTQYLVIYMMDISESWGNIRSSQDVLEELKNLLINSRTEQEDTPTSDKLSIPSVSLQHIHISYGETQAIRDLTLNVPCGEFLIITGQSGSGKTSLLNALQRYVDYSGRYLLSGESADKIPENQFRSNFACVSQNDDLLPVTVYENLTMGNPHISRQKVIDILKELNIYDTLEQLPQGMNTMAGLNGMELSGGEKQRVCLARALLKDAPVMLLDEPTSALDAMNEQIVVRKLSELKNKCIMMASHRVAVFKYATRIIWLNEGEIIAQGTYDELLKSTEFREYIAQISDT